MLSKASSSKFHRIFFFFWLIMLMFSILQPITSARKLAGGGSKMRVHGSPTTPAHSAIGGGGGGSGSGYRNPAVCSTNRYASCIAYSNAPRRPCSTYNRCKSKPRH
ncbi:hypothetical protein CsSME_00022300 [Camellia sinensis var. sinensis]